MDKELSFIEIPGDVQGDGIVVELSELQLILVGGGCGETVVG